MVASGTKDDLFFLLPAVVDCGDNVAFESDFFIAD
jgi:hypothetical protein